jgi:hypothetical protein
VRLRKKWLAAFDACYCAERAAAESSTARRLRLSIALPPRSCDGGGRRALSSHVSQNSGAAERENGTAVDRLSPAGMGSSPQHSQHADCHRSVPSRRSMHLALRSRRDKSQAESPSRISISPSNTTYITSRLSPSLKRKSLGASCSVSVSLRKRSAGFTRAETTKGKRQVPSYDCATTPGIAQKQNLRVLHVLRG